MAATLDEKQSSGARGAVTFLHREQPSWEAHSAGVSICGREKSTGRGKWVDAI